MTVIKYGFGSLADAATDIETSSRNIGTQLEDLKNQLKPCLLYTSPSPRDRTRSRMPSSA